MAQRERTTNGGAVKTGVYDAPETQTHTTTTPRTTSHTTDVVEPRPTDLVRWGPVLAGLFAALATLIALSLLGLAIGASTYNPTDTTGEAARNLGLGAGIWGAISTLLAFLVGGLIAGRAAAFSGKTSGILNGAMIWFVAIPLLVYLLSSGIGALARTAGNVAGTAATVAGTTLGQAAGEAANDPALQATAQAGAADIGQAAQATAQALTGQITPQDEARVAEATADTAWSTLLSLGLAAGASILGGYLGARPRDKVATTSTTRAA